jgi:hypothetical protein
MFMLATDSHERVHSMEGVTLVALGLYVIRGDNVYVLLCVCMN